MLDPKIEAQIVSRIHDLERVIPKSSKTAAAKLKARMNELSDLLGWLRRNA